MKSRSKALKVVFGITTAGILITLAVFLWMAFGMDRSGWTEENGLYSYLDARGDPVTGWMEEDGNQYFFDENGIMVTGWQTIEGSRFWFSPAGIRRTGWIEDSGNRYYLTETGASLSGWNSVDGQRRYFLEGNQLATGWQTIDGSRYYLSEDGTLVTGWLYTPEGVYHLSESGHLSTGLTQLDGNTYYFFETSGMMHQGWLDLNEDRYYFDDSGAMVTGWQEIDGKRRYFEEDGTMHTGWLQQGEYSYYLLEDGSAATEPTVIDGRTCFFTPEGIYVLLVNYKYPLPDGYQVELVRYGQWARVAAIAEESLRQMILDCRATGIECWLNCGYRTVDEQTTILNERMAGYIEDGMDRDSAYAKTLETVAVPGYSEHHTGLAVDVVCSVDPVWLHEHCWEYGFILRYPEGKSDITGITYEHWHYRYVGTEVSMAMKDSGLCLEEYLGAA